MGKWLGLVRDHTRTQEQHPRSTNSEHHNLCGLSEQNQHQTERSSTTKHDGSPQEQALAFGCCKRNLKDVPKYHQALDRPYYLSTTLLQWQAAFFFFYVALKAHVSITLSRRVSHHEHWHLLSSILSVIPPLHVYRGNTAHAWLTSLPLHFFFSLSVRFSRVKCCTSAVKVSKENNGRDLTCIRASNLIHASAV